jgi:hypothetical protein
LAYSAHIAPAKWNNGLAELLWQLNYNPEIGDFEMITKIPDLPENVVGFLASGKVTRDDYESVVIPAVQAAFARQDKVRCLYHLGEDFSGFEAAAMWDDAKIGLKHYAGWERIAVVSDADWIGWAVKIFGVAMPATIRVFHNRELADAKRWISE